MDRLNRPEDEASTEGRGKKQGFFARLFSAVAASFERREDKLSPVADISTLVIAFLFARCHIIFGSYPLSIAAIAVLPSRVWLAVIGSVVGSLTLGKAGIIYAMISLIVAFLRIIISGTEKNTRQDEDGSPLFKESLILRMSSAVIGGFISGVYEVLLNGFTLTSVMFGVSMILLPPVIAFALSGIFEGNISLSGIFRTNLPVLSLKGKDEKEKFNLIFFECSALFGLFLISLSLKEYELLGISPSYVFSSLVTLYAARRFGAIKGAVVGFVSSVGISSSYSVGLALAGVVSGWLFGVGLIYALLGGLTALSLWCSYAGGVVGLLTVFPEFAIAAMVASPILKATSAEKKEEQREAAGKIAEDMVGTMALSYKSRYQGNLDTLEEVLSSLSTLIRRKRKKETELSKDELSEVSRECIRRYCSTCSFYHICAVKDNHPLRENIELLTTTLYKNGRITSDIPELSYSDCKMQNGIIESINRAVSSLKEERIKESMKGGIEDDFTLIARLISEARESDRREKALNESLSERIEDTLLACGVSEGFGGVYGQKRPHLIVSLEDEDGSRATSPELKKELEALLGSRLCNPEYYRKGKMALFECSVDKNYSVDFVSVGVGKDDGISGDASLSFVSRDGYFFSIISDGMGSGEEAHDTAVFVLDFLNRALEFSGSIETTLQILNHTLKRAREECSASLDLFYMDLYTGEAGFIKSGASASYIKRGSSLFRIRSKTAPLGVTGELDAERVRADIECGDCIIMLSDGVTENASDAPWLLDLLAKPTKDNLEDYAELILSEAKKNGRRTDDMTVTVLKTSKVTQ